MFSLQFNQFNDPGSNQNKDDKDGDDDGEEPADWVQALLRWNSQGPKSAAVLDRSEPNAQVVEDGTETTKKENKSPIPLAALVNVEALLMASGSALDEIDAEFGLLSNFGALGDASTNRVKDGNATADISSIEDVSPNPLTLLPKLEEQGDWNKLVSSLQQSVMQRTTSDGEAMAFAAENILNEATKRMELFLNETSSVVPPGTVEHLIMRASQVLNLDERGSRFPHRAFFLRRCVVDHGSHLVATELPPHSLL